MKYIPVSSANSCGQIHYGVPVIYDARQYVTRVDWVMNQKNQLYGRYLQDNYDQPAPFSTTNYLYTTTLGVNQRPQTFVLGETYAINPRTLNSFHFTFGRKFVARFPNTKGIDPADLGVAPIYTPPLATDNLQLSVSNSFSTGGSGFSKWGVNSFQEADDVDLTRGKHQIAFGGEIIRTQDNQNDEYNDSGTFSFTGIYSGDPLLDFLMGYMPSFTQTLQQDYSYRQTLVELYGQDTVRLTLEVGHERRPALGADASAARLFQPRQCLLPAGLYPPETQPRLSQRPRRPVLLGRSGRNKVVYLRSLAQPLSAYRIRL